MKKALTLLLTVLALSTANPIDEFKRGRLNEDIYQAVQGAVYGFLSTEAPTLFPCIETLSNI